LKVKLNTYKLKNVFLRVIFAGVHDVI